MQRDTAIYISGFAALICVICGFMVSSAAVSLREQQAANAAFDKQRNVLYATGLASPLGDTTREELEAIYEERIKPVVVELETGQVVENPPFDPALYNMEKAAGGEAGRPAPANLANVQRLPQYAVVYHVMSPDGDTVEMVVLPIKGYGLWSTLYGFIALDRDTTTVRGITYYQHGETPGLGGEVDNPSWKALWPGRKVYDQDWDVALDVVKGQAGPPSADPYQVDGLSGATITSRGVDNMIDFWLGENGFKPYLENFREQRS